MFKLVYGVVIIIYFICSKLVLHQFRCSIVTYHKHAAMPVTPYWHRCMFVISISIGKTNCNFYFEAAGDLVAAKFN